MNEWFQEVPKESGTYWFYGDPFMGSMGCHYMEGDKYQGPDARLIFVTVSICGNGLLATGDGQFIGLREFDKEKRIPGCVGYWKKEEVKLPKDVDGLFKKGD